MHLLIEEALSQELEVDRGTKHFSPTGSEYDHIKLKHDPQEYACVSILRAGDSMIEPMFGLIPDISVGKILIQRNEKAEPVFYYSKLPTDIHKSKRVFLLDPMLATGGSASVAISKLIDSGVPADRITFINLVACDNGITRINRDHPDVAILTAVVDPELNHKCYILPGLGDYGDRFFASTRE